MLNKRTDGGVKSSSPCSMQRYLFYNQITSFDLELVERAVRDYSKHRKNYLRLDLSSRFSDAQYVDRGFEALARRVEFLHSEQGRVARNGELEQLMQIVQLLPQYERERVLSGWINRE